MLDKHWFINEITRVDVSPVGNKGVFKAYITVYYGILGIRGFRAYQKEKDGNRIFWIKAPSFNSKNFSEVPILERKKYKSLWFQWMEKIRDMYLEWLEKNSEEISDEDLDRITKEIDKKTNNSY